MRKSVLSAAFLTAVLAAPAAAAGTTGPFAGAVSQGQTRSHEYNNNPRNDLCIQIEATYTVTLTYAPATDVLTLSALGKTVTGTGGVAVLDGSSGWCTAFSIDVRGRSVAVTAPYAVTVARAGLGGLTG